MSYVHSTRKYLFAEAMRIAGIGKAWRRKYLKMPSEDAFRFESYAQHRARTDLQWADAWQRFTAALVARELGCS